MNQLFSFIAILTAINTTTSFANEVYFTPGLACEDRTVKAIDQTKKSIHGIIQNINSPRIYAALKRAKKRGVKISLITESRHALGKSSKAYALKKIDVNVKLQSQYKSENNRYAVFDNRLLFTGTFNWSTQSTISASTNCLFINDVKTIANHNSHFKKSWVKNPSSKSDQVFAYIHQIRSDRATASKK